MTAHGGNGHHGVGCWRTVTSQQKAFTRLLSSQQKASARQSAPKRNEFGFPTNYHGQKRGLVILAEFTDLKFKATNNREKYDNILNTPGYTTSEGFRGSVADYFRDQSDGLFELQFDVVGPFTTKYNYKYYGENNDHGDDKHAEDMIVEMCQAADSLVNFADYDWDGDGEADEVFVLYAGMSESDTDKADYIWPHMWSLDEAGLQLFLDGMKINIYACSNELKASGRINGIGTFCHEFSHCMGLPDFYDTLYSGEFGMADFDLMSSGNYAGNGFSPVGYTAYEKMFCGWQEPIVLSDEDVTIDSLRPISEHGDFYIIYNDGHPSEYYMIENRQKTGWDKSYPAKGLMITHVDYDTLMWVCNLPNTVITMEKALELYGLPISNDHQRMTIFHADNNDDKKYWNAIGGYYTKSTASTDLYPYQKNDSLTATSAPAATLFHQNADSTMLMQGAILDIKQNADGTINFRYRAKVPIADAIQRINGDRPRQGIYTLDGRKVNSPSKKGIYIIDGKKVVY
jgi:M6 family metalloprotease-like protein